MAETRCNACHNGTACARNNSREAQEWKSTKVKKWPWTVILKWPLFLVPLLYDVNSTKIACKCVPLSKPKPISIGFIWLREGSLWPTFVHAQGPQLFVSKPHWHAPSIVVKKYYGGSVLCENLVSLIWAIGKYMVLLSHFHFLCFITIMFQTSIQLWNSSKILVCFLKGLVS